ncbi:MAG: ABC transporter permease, partial [Pseudomonadales bacterium]|nr:ABC transporter permease [Pseudomonadales bacterium]
MYKPLSIYIGQRYLRAKRRSHFISFISLSSIFGLALSIAVLITVLSVINGFQRELEQRILGLIPQAKLYSYEPLADWEFLAGQLINDDQVQGAAPFIELQGMLSANQHVKPAFVTGIDPNYEKDVSIIESFITGASLQVLAPGGFGIIMDSVTAKELELNIGD